MKQRKITVQEQTRKKHKNRQTHIQMREKTIVSQTEKRKRHWIILNYNTFLLKCRFDLSCMRMATILNE